MQEKCNMNYADIHCHILPGVDDGAEHMDVSMQMLQISYDEGARIIVLTPHYEGGRNQYTPEELEDKFEELKKQASGRWKDLQLYLGNELLYETGIDAHIKDGRVHRMHQTRYVLVEFCVQIDYEEMYQAMRNMRKLSTRPIIAHVERYHCLTKHPERIDELREMGIYLQMNATSVLGSMWNERVKWCRKLLKEQQISFIGTDAHGVDCRTPHMEKALTWMQKTLDRNYLENILWNYPIQMLADEQIER